MYIICCGLHNTLCHLAMLAANIDVVTNIDTE